MAKAARLKIVTSFSSLKTMAFSRSVRFVFSSILFTSLSTIVGHGADDPLTSIQTPLFIPFMSTLVGSCVSSPPIQDYLIEIFAYYSKLI